MHSTHVRAKYLTLILMFFFIIGAGCSLGSAVIQEFKQYGPWKARIIDHESRKPIEGAVVAALWYFRNINLGSAEAITDKNGYFVMRSRSFRGEPTALLLRIFKE